MALAGQMGKKGAGRASVLCRQGLEVVLRAAGRGHPWLLPVLSGAAPCCWPYLAITHPFCTRLWLAVRAADVARTAAPCSVLPWPFLHPLSRLAASPPRAPAAAWRSCQTPFMAGKVPALPCYKLFVVQIPKASLHGHRGTCPVTKPGDPRSCSSIASAVWEARVSVGGRGLCQMLPVLRADRDGPAPTLQGSHLPGQQGGGGAHREVQERVRLPVRRLPASSRSRCQRAVVTACSQCRRSMQGRDASMQRLSAAKPLLPTLTPAA